MDFVFEKKDIVNRVDNRVQEIEKVNMSKVDYDKLSDLKGDYEMTKAIVIKVSEVAKDVQSSSEQANKSLRTLQDGFLNYIKTMEVVGQALQENVSENL